MTREDREQIFKTYCKCVVHLIISIWKNKLPSSVDRDDLAQIARIAVWDATATWSEDKGMSFKSWAICKAKWSVIDWIRDKATILTRAHRRAGVTEVCSLDSLDEIGKPISVQICDESSDDDRKQIEYRDLIGVMLAKLPEKKRAIISARLSGKFLWQIGDAVGMTESGTKCALDKVMALVREMIEVELTADDVFGGK